MDGHLKADCWDLHLEKKAEHKAKINKRYGNKRKSNGDSLREPKKPKTNDSEDIAIIICLTLDNISQITPKCRLKYFNSKFIIRTTNFGKYTVRLSPKSTPR